MGAGQGKYTSGLKSKITLHVNNSVERLNIENGYAVIRRTWKKGDKIKLGLPMQPRIIKAHEQVKDLKGLIALASGPLIYCMESADNNNLDRLKLDASAPLELSRQSELLGGVNIIKGTAGNENSTVSITAIPYYAVGNRHKAGYKVWLPER